ncbi:MAG TPA: DegT/DnrJ/EryC1/StrS family aminotransferase [bacterium]|nr:DegT/DnrJ/EryC1/StrS family aminotransferase [bacterium]
MIPFLDLKVQYQEIKTEIAEALDKILESNQYTLGKEVTAFEEEFASYCAAGQGIAVNSGTSALHLALLAAGVGPGDEVITTPFTFVATVAAILYTGASPVLIDIDPKYYTFDVSRLEAAITDKTKAIIPVHLYGHPADMEAVLDTAQARKIVVIEDACQAHGSEYRGKRVGSLGDMGCFSFYPGKNLGAYGEGGIVVTDNPEYAQKIRMLRDWGQEKKYHHVMLGYNYRMDGFQGAVLRVKLRHLEQWTEARRHIAAVYSKALENVDVIPPSEKKNCRHVYHIYAARVQNRDRVIEALKKEGIHTGIHYPYPVHVQEGYVSMGYKKGDFPIAEQIASEVISLPMYPELSEEEVREVASVLGAILK